jgi:CRP/FNR family transcriptional regulator
MENAWYLSQIYLFEGISDMEIMRIAAKAQDQRYAACMHLYGPHDGRDRNVFILKEGEVCLYHSRDGRKTVFDVLGPGSVFGHFLPRTEGASHHAEALPGSRVCVLTPEDFQKVIASHPDVLMRLVQTLADRLSDYERKLELDTGSALERVLGELKRYSRKKRNPFSLLTAEPPLALSHEKLAELTGLNRVTVTRMLKLLKLRGDIDIDERGRITPK